MKFDALRKAIADRDSISFWGNDNPKCPHCGYDTDIAAHDLYSLVEEGSHEVECPSCGDEFTVVTAVSYTFHTDEQEEMDDEEPQ